MECVRVRWCMHTQIFKYYACTYGRTYGHTYIHTYIHTFCNVSWALDCKMHDLARCCLLPMTLVEVWTRAEYILVLLVQEALAKKNKNNNCLSLTCSWHVCYVKKQINNHAYVCVCVHAHVSYCYFLVNPVCVCVRVCSPITLVPPKFFKAQHPRIGRKTNRTPPFPARKFPINESIETRVWLVKSQCFMVWLFLAKMFPPIHCSKPKGRRAAPAMTKATLGSLPLWPWKMKSLLDWKWIASRAAWPVWWLIISYLCGFDDVFNYHLCFCYCIIIFIICINIICIWKLTAIVNRLLSPLNVIVKNIYIYLK